MNDFAIERPRKICICIAGYNPEEQIRARDRKQRERHRRLKVRAEAEAGQQAPARPAVLAGEESRDHTDELAALSNAAATRPLGHEPENELCAAFAEQDGTLANRWTIEAHTVGCAFLLLEIRVEKEIPSTAAAKARPGGRKNHPPALRPVRELLRLLPLLTAADGASKVTPGPSGDLANLAGCAEACIRTVHLGLGALGHLVARCSMDLQDGSVPSESIENLGFLMAELGDLAAECMRIAAQCRSGQGGEG
jgi:hypothetical protein